MGAEKAVCQAPFHKLNIGNSSQKTCKSRSQTFHLISGFTGFLYFVRNILPRLVWVNKFSVLTRPSLLQTLILWHFICYQSISAIFNQNMHCMENHIFLFRTPWTCWNMIFLVLLGKMIFPFPENIILHLRRKIKDYLSLKIHRNIKFSSGPQKRWSFQKAPCRHLIFFVLSANMVFFSRTPDLFSSGRKWNTAFPRKYMETWCTAQRRKTVTLIYRVEDWLLLKFIRLQIFYNE